MKKLILWIPIIGLLYELYRIVYNKSNVPVDELYKIWSIYQLFVGCVWVILLFIFVL